MRVEKIFEQSVLIPDEYIIAYSPLPKNFDLEDIRPFIKISESVHIVPIIGQALYDELLKEIEDDSVSDVNSTLLLNIYPLEAICIVSEALPFIWASLADKGVTLGKSDNSDSVSAKDLTSIQNHISSQISVLKRTLKEWIESHSDCYPLFENKCCCEKKELTSVRLYSNSMKRTKDNL